MLAVPVAMLIAGVAAVLLAMLGYPQQAGVLGVTLLLVLGIVGVVQVAMPAHARVGTDGVYLTWASQELFIPLSEMERVEVRAGRPAPFGDGADRVVVHRRGNTTVEIPVARRTRQLDARTKSWKERRQGAMAIRDRLEAALAAAQSRLRSPDVPALPTHHGGGTTAWVAELRGLVQAGQYRHLAPPAEHELWALVEDVQRPPATRAASAVALGVALDTEGRARIRALADETAFPSLRYALLALARDDDGDLLFWLADLAGRK